MPKTCKILPKWPNFAKSGRTVTERVSQDKKRERKKNQRKEEQNGGQIYSNEAENVSLTEDDRRIAATESSSLDARSVLFLVSFLLSCFCYCCCCCRMPNRTNEGRKEVSSSSSVCPFPEWESRIQKKKFSVNLRKFVKTFVFRCMFFKKNSWTQSALCFEIKNNLFRWRKTLDLTQQCSVLVSYLKSDLGFVWQASYLDLNFD